MKQQLNLLKILKEIKICKGMSHKKSTEAKDRIKHLSDEVKETFGEPGLHYFNQIVNVYGLGEELSLFSLEEKITPLCQLAYLEEKNGTAEDHAKKLATIFKDENKVLDYLLKYPKGNTYTYLVHDACLFQLPELDAHWLHWNKIANQNDMMCNPSFRRLLPHLNAIAKIIEEGISNKNKPNLKEIQALKQELLNKNKEYTQLDSHDPDDQTTDRRQTLATIAAQRSKLRINLANLCSGLSWDYIDLPILQAFDELYLQKVSSAHQILVENGISDKNIAIFKLLERHNDDMAIPNVVIDGSKIGYSGYSLEKLDIMTEEGAAIAACLGIMTNCCQFLGGAGEECAKHGISSPNGGFYVLYDNHKKIVAQSWVWRDDQVLCLDSIEINPKADEKLVADMFRYLGHILVQNKEYQITYVNVGARSGISAEVGLEQYPIVEAHLRDYHGYKDSGVQLTLAVALKPYLFHGKNHSTQLDDLIARDTRLFLLQLFNENTPLKDNEALKEFIGSMIEDNRPELIALLKEMAGDKQKSLDALILQNQTYYFNLENKNINVECIQQGAYLNLKNGEHWTGLHIASYHQDIIMVQELIKHGININIKDWYGQTALFLTLKEVLYEQRISKGRDVAKILIDKGADLEIENKVGETPLILAAQNSDFELVSYMIDHGANLDVEGGERKTAIFWAAEKGNFDMFELLFNKKARLDAVSHFEGFNMLMAACKGENQRIVEILLSQNDTDLNSKDRYENTALMIAIDSKSFSIVETLLKQPGIDLNSKGISGSTALMKAIDKNCFNIVQQLVEKGADIDIYDNNLRNAIFKAALVGNFEIFEYLYYKKANINAVDNTDQNNIFLAAVQGQNLKIVELLLGLPSIDINYQNKKGETALFLAITNLDFNMVQVLIDHGLDIEIKNKYMETAIYYAARHGCLQIFTYLLEQKAALEGFSSDTKENILMAAVLGGQPNIVNILLSQIKIDLDYKNTLGKTVFHLAVEYPQCFASLCLNLSIEKKLEVLLLTDIYESTVFHSVHKNLETFKIALNGLSSTQILEVLKIPNKFRTTMLDKIHRNPIFLDEIFNRLSSKDLLILVESHFDIEYENLLELLVSNSERLQMIFENYSQDERLARLLRIEKSGNRLIDKVIRFHDSLKVIIKTLTFAQIKELVMNMKKGKTLLSDLCNYPEALEMVLKALDPKDVLDVISMVNPDGFNVFYSAYGNHCCLDLLLHAIPHEYRLQLIIGGFNANQALIKDKESFIYRVKSNLVILNSLSPEQRIVFLQMMDNDSKTELFAEAARLGHIEVFDYFKALGLYEFKELNKKPYLRYQHYSAFSLATKQGQLKVLTYLLENVPEEKNQMMQVGSKELYYTIIAGHHDVLKFYYKELGPSCLEQFRSKPDLILSGLTKIAEGGHISMLQFLNEIGEIDMKQLAKTLYDTAVSYKHQDLAKWLLAIIKQNEPNTVIPLRFFSEMERNKTSSEDIERELNKAIHLMGD